MASDLLTGLAPLRERIFAGDNTHCFVERQCALAALAPVLETLPARTRYAAILERLLAEASTPIEPEDVILGRMVEGPLPEGLQYHHNLPGFATNGHLTLDWPALLRRGLRALAAEARATADSREDDEAAAFAENAGRCCEALCGFAERYAAAAEEQAETAPPARRAALLRAARALRAAPAGPAPDFYAALQAIWLVQLVFSCYVGARDFAFGRLDQYLLPHYRRGLADGTLTPSLARACLAHFLLKTKEITGTTTDNYRTKPCPSCASNQYVVLGGRAATGETEANELSVLVLQAAALVKLPQPELNIRLDSATPSFLRRAVEQALPACHSQVQFWNDDAIVPQLRARGLPDEEACGYALTACNRTNLPGVLDFEGGDAFHNMAAWLLAALGDGSDPLLGEFEGILAAYAQVAEREVATAVAERSAWMRGAPGEFHFESVLLRGCVARGRDYSRGGLPYRAQYHFFGGVATVANSLVALRELIYAQRRFTLPQFLKIVADGFAGHERLRQEVLTSLPKYGNGDPGADELARRVCELALDALEAAPNPDAHLLLPSIYSLYLQVPWGEQLPATPDGRLQGEPISENQSPAHGTDRAGVTALLRSVAHLPLARTPAGGLNLRLGFRPQPQTALQLVESFFALGGIHLGFTFVDREDLLAARLRPAEYRSLCVRVTGFSEFFIALSPAAQADVIARTGY